MTVLRTTEWDGPDPAEGDVVQLPGGDVALVEWVARGAGLGQWTLHVSPRRLLAFRPAP